MESKFNKVNQDEYYIIRSMSMMMYLVRHGFNVIKVGDSEEDSKFKVFMFMDSYELRQCMSKYKK